MANVIADYLSSKFEEVTPYDFYREIFGTGILDERGNFHKGKYVGIAVELEYGDEKKPKKVTNRRKHIITDELDEVDELAWSSDNFCITSPISYAGWSRTTKNARTMFALGVEIDNLLVETRDDGTTYFKGLEALMHQWNTIDKYTGHTFLPKPTFLVASGRGVHLYYHFDQPLRLAEWVKKSLMLYKEKLTRMLWNQYITADHQEEKIQYESAFQAFRMVGSPTRLGLKTKSREDRCRAFRVGEKVTIDYMNSFLDALDIKKGMTISPTYEGKTTLSEAREKWPEWYQTTVVEGKKYSKKWDIAGKVNGDDPYALYHWWLNKIRSGAVFGKRYHCMYCLAVYAIKNDVPEEKLIEDCYDLLDWFDALTPANADEKDHFTEDDIEAALQVFEDRGYFNYPIKKISKRSGIQIERNKRNGRTQSEHLKRARKVQEADYPDGEWRNINGRPQGSKNKQYEKKELVVQYRAEHPDANVTEVARALGISRPTVYKWWDAKPTAESTPKRVSSDPKPKQNRVADHKSPKTAPEPAFDWRAHMADAVGLSVEDTMELIKALQEGKIKIKDEE